jgi:hypothetical protein
MVPVARAPASQTIVGSAGGARDDRGRGVQPLPVALPTRSSARA